MFFRIIATHRARRSFARKPPGATFCSRLGGENCLLGIYLVVTLARNWRNAGVEIIEDCANVPQVERLEVLGPLVAGFLN
ncbi:MAG: hypothetical protein WBD71_10770, partial [Xanthobacteraceae bacterium]